MLIWTLSSPKSEAWETGLRSYSGEIENSVESEWHWSIWSYRTDSSPYSHIFFFFLTIATSLANSVENAEQFLSKGVSGIYVVAVNDAFTTQAWKEKLGANNSQVHFLADDTAAVSTLRLSGSWSTFCLYNFSLTLTATYSSFSQFTTASGQLFDASGLLGNKRSSRYAAIVNNGTVEKIFVEDEAPSVTVTKADNVLQQLWGMKWKNGMLENDFQL